MHALPTLLSITLLAVAASAGAQNELSQADPGTIPLNTDPADGVYFETPAVITYNITQGDWFQFNVANWYDETHGLSISGYGHATSAAPFLDGGDVTWGPFQFDEAGVFEVRDETTGDFAVLVVQEADVASQSDPGADDGAMEDEGPASDEGMPGFGALALLGVLSLAALRRR